MSSSRSLARLRFKWRRFSRNLDPGRSALCLDVGSGDAPWPRADVLLEAHPTTAGHAGELIVDRPLVLGSVEAMPFRDGAFAYAHASHLLEHVADPAQALRELTRVASRGYLEVPTRLHELLSPRPDHLWAVTLDGGRLLFDDLPARLPELAGWFARSFAADPRFESFYWSRYFDDFVHVLAWEGHIPCEVHGAPRSQPRQDVDSAELSACLMAAKKRAASVRARAKRLLGRALGASRPTLDCLLACPDCLGPLLRSSRGLDCARCRHVFPVIHEVPVLYPLGTRPRSSTPRQP